MAAKESMEKQLWKAADKLRKNIDAAEYKHIVLGLIFLKYISDVFEEMKTLVIIRYIFYFICVFICHGVYNLG
jgi:type I restriction-modification system DNA methylase subunit